LAHPKRKKTMQRKIGGNRGLDVDKKRCYIKGKSDD